MPTQQDTILTITLNPALDLSVDAPMVQPGPKIRVAQPITEAGGGGLNVSRAILRLDGHSRAFAALGGLTGARVAELLRAEGVDLTNLEIAGETRQNVSVTDIRDGGQYRFTLPGPEWDATQVTRFQDAVTASLPSEGLVVLSGSQPPGVPPGFPSHLVACAARMRARVIIDTSGPALTTLMESPATHPPFMLRLDETEVRGLRGEALDPPAAADLAGGLVGRGVARMLVVACGAAGSVLVTAQERLHCTPPVVKVRSKVGAGDSFTAGFTLALARRASFAQALQLGTAAAAAAVMTESTALCRGEDVQALLPQCRVTEI
ncbi:MAG: hexose kinase [Pararhodobacter sp.]|nr:hexose kinase [Pararhodobacter sp.]